MSIRRLNVLTENYFPAYVVWELTLKCDQNCVHCGSRANEPRNNELKLSEALSLIKELSQLGCKEVVLIGGEAYLHRDFFEIIRALARTGIRVGMTSGGRGVAIEHAQEMKAAGLSFASISVDGLKHTHDTIRANKGSYDAATKALHNLYQSGIRTSVNTNINRVNKDELEPLYEILKSLKVNSWQVQITAPLGRAADRPHMILQPYDVLDVMPLITQLKKRGLQEGLLLMPGNNLGYFGPEERLLRSLNETDNDHWLSCQAGKFILGIESDGGVKGCPSLQSEHYLAGNIRHSSLKNIWHNAAILKNNRKRSVKDLWGFCAHCDYNRICLAGCTFTAHSVLNRPGNNPYCHFRALKFKHEGKKERLVKVKDAPNRPFDNASWKIIEEPFNKREPEIIPEKLLSISRKKLKQRGNTSSRPTVF